MNPFRFIFPMSPFEVFKIKGPKQAILYPILFLLVVWGWINYYDIEMKKADKRFAAQEKLKNLPESPVK